MLVKHIVTFFMLVMAPDFPAHQEKNREWYRFNSTHRSEQYQFASLCSMQLVTTAQKTNMSPKNI